MSDPSVQLMTDTQWLFELESLSLQTERKYEEIGSFTKLVQDGLINLLGLNLMPVPEVIPEEEGGGLDEEGEPITRLRRAEEGEIVPLAMLIGSPEVISEVVKQNQELYSQLELDEKEEQGEIVHRTPEELDEFFEDDIEFPDNPEDFRKSLIWNSEETQNTLKHLVKPLEKEPLEKEPEEGAVVLQSPRKRSRVTIDHASR